MTKTSIFFLDGGSGLAHRGHELGESPARKRFHFLVTHTHWDHILGYPFFKPLYDPSNQLVFYASKTERAQFHDAVGHELGFLRRSGAHGKEGSIAREAVIGNAVGSGAVGFAQLLADLRAEAIL